MFERMKNLIRGFFSLFVSGLERANPQALIEAEKENLRRQIGRFNENLANHAAFVERLMRQVKNLEANEREYSAKAAANLKVGNRAAAGQYALQLKTVKEQLDENRQQLEAADDTYKKLVKSLEKSEKVAGKTRERVEKMQGQADKVFSAWTQELDSYENEQLKDLGMQRLDASKQRYGVMIERMESASEAYRPLVSSLHDQIKLMGFDLSPEAMGALQGPAEELNAMSVELFARIDAVLNQEQQDEAAIADQDDVLADQEDALADQSE